MVLVDFIAYTGLFLLQMFRGKKFFSAKFWKYALLFNIPRIPHYWSTSLLENSGRNSKKLPTFNTKQLPVRQTFDNNYFNALYQSIPIGGYTKMIENMLEGIEVRLNVDYIENKEELDKLAEKVVYTGAINVYFGYKLGYLEYRSVRFDTEVLGKSNFQGNAAVNYIDKETPWTRIIEHKWFEFGKDENGNDLPKTVISR